MEYSIFYSWQTDTPAKCNRTFIREAIEAAVTALVQDAQVEDSPRVDSGMEGVAGTPEVATVMFEKIRKSAIFIGDVTLVGSIPKRPKARNKILRHAETIISERFGLEIYHPRKGEKLVPNPNVLLEMGYAAGTIGWERIICVMNESFGTRMEQPFDVRNRRFPINYTLHPENMTDKSKAKASLIKDLKTAIQGVLESEHAGIHDAIDSLDLGCLGLMSVLGRADWFSENHFRNIRGNADSIGVTIRRLLDLRLLKADVNATEGLYAYHWTYLGKQVLTALNMRERTALATGDQPDAGPP